MGQYGQELEPSQSRKDINSVFEDALEYGFLEQKPPENIFQDLL